jgi:hypothetical protein
MEPGVSRHIAPSEGTVEVFEGIIETRGSSVNRRGRRSIDQGLPVRAAPGASENRGPVNDVNVNKESVQYMNAN